MGVQNTIQPSFTSGELSPRMLGRLDLSRYSAGLAALQNFIIMPQGGIYRRSGTIFVNAVQNMANFTRLIPFTFSTIQAYVLEFGNQYIQFYRNGAQIQNPVPGPAVQVATPYLTSELSQINYTQSADTLYLAHPNHPPMILTRTSNIAWQLSLYQYVDGPYLPLNTTATTLASSAATGTTTINASAPLFAATDVGRWVSIQNGTIRGAAQITAFNSPTSVTASILASPAFPMPTTAQSAWQLGAWSATTGWPSVVTFHQQRLIWANTSSQPQNFWMSKSSDYVTFSPSEANVTVIDSDSVFGEIRSSQVNAIVWLISGSVLFVGTVGGEWQLRASGYGTTVLTPTSLTIAQGSYHGSANVRPVRIDSPVIYVQRAGRKVLELALDLSQGDGIVSGLSNKNLILVSEHLGTSGIVDACYQQEPDSVWWGVRGDGTLIGLTYLKEEQIYGWHRHVIGGSYNGGQAVIESCAVIPHPDGTQDQLWLIVKRTINGQTTRYIEIMDKPFAPTNPTDKLSMNFVDCGLSYSGPPLAHFSGLTQLIGQTVSVWADGAVRPSCVVDKTGSVTLQTPGSVVQIGLPYLSQLQTMPLDVQGENGTGQGKPKRISRVLVRFSNTLGGKAGTDFNHLIPLLFRAQTDQMDLSPPLFTGDMRFDLNQSYETYAQYCIQQDLPYPMTILALMPEAVVYPG